MHLDRTGVLMSHVATADNTLTWCQFVAKVGQMQVLCHSCPAEQAHLCVLLQAPVLVLVCEPCRPASTDRPSTIYLAAAAIQLLCHTCQLWVCQVQGSWWLPCLPQVLGTYSKAVRARVV